MIKIEVDLYGVTMSSREKSMLNIKLRNPCSIEKMMFDKLKYSKENSDCFLYAVNDRMVSSKKILKDKDKLLVLLPICGG